MAVCRRCGATDRHQMIGAMTRWFGPCIGLPPEQGYFYLCPACDAAVVGPELEAIRERLLAHHTGERLDPPEGTGGAR
jgi:hypothetical protein